MSLYHGVSDQERARIRENRKRWIELIEHHVKTNGDCIFTPDIRDELSDPEYSPLMLVAFALDGRRLPERVTWQKALADLCGKHGWKQHDNILNQTIVVIAPIRRWKCPTCEGRGIAGPLQFRPVGSWDDLGQVTDKLCSHCRGGRVVESRTDPNLEICWLKYDFNAPTWQNDGTMKLGRFVERNTPC